MVGLIWFVQVVHYPMFSLVGTDAFSQYESVHQRLTTYIVAPLMLLELGTAIALVVNRPPEIPVASVWIALILVGVAWLSTAVLQIPAHSALQSGFDDTIHQRLVSTNWIRTTPGLVGVCWSFRGLRL